MADERLSSIATDQPFKEYRELISLNNELVSGIIELSKVGRSLEINIKGVGNLKEVTTTQQQIVANSNAIVDAQKQVIQINNILANSVSEITGNIAANSKQQQQYKIELANVRKEIKDLGNQTDVYGNVLNKNKAKIADLTAQESRLKVALAEVGATLKTQIQQENAAGGSVLALTAKVRELEFAYNSLTDAERKSKFGTALQAEVKILNTELDTLQSGLGKNTRQVGGYTNAIQKAFSGIRQLAYILPGIGIAGIFGLLFEGIEVGVKFLYDYIKGLDTATGATRRFKMQVEDLNSSISGTEYAAAIKNVNELKINIDLAKRGFLDKDKVLRQYNDTIGKTTGQVSSLDEAEVSLIKNADAYIRMTLYKAAAQIALEAAAKKAYEAELTRRKKESEFSSNVDDFSALAAGADRSENADPQELAKRRERAQREAARRRTLRKEDALKEQQKDAEAQVDIAKGFQSQAASIALQSKFDLYGGSFSPEKTKSPKDLTNEKLKAETDYTKGLYAEQSKRSELEAEIQKGIVDDDKSSLQQRLTAYTLYTQRRLEQAGFNLAGEYQATEEMLNKIKQIEGKAAKDRTQEESDLLLKKDEYTQHLVNLEIDYNIKAKSLTNDLSKFRADAIEKDAKATEAARKKYESDNYASPTYKPRRDKGKAIIDLDDDGKNTLAATRSYADAAISALNGVNDVLNQISQRRLQAIQDEKDALESLTQQQIDAVNNSVGSEDVRNKKIGEIKARAAAKQEALDAKARAEQRKAAERQKAIDIAQIIIRTALAVVTALATPPAPVGAALAIAAAVAGAAELAVAIATPIPAFKDGVTDFEGGLAWTGDGGKREPILSKDGTLRLSPARATLTQLKRGDTVFPDMDAFLKSTYGMTINGGMMSRSYSEIDNSEVVGELKDVGRKIVRAIDRQEPVKIKEVTSFYTPAQANKIRRN